MIEAELVEPTLRPPMMADHVGGQIHDPNFHPGELPLENSVTRTESKQKKSDQSVDRMRQLLHGLMKRRGVGSSERQPIVETTSSPVEKERLSKLRSKSTQTMFLKLAELHESGDLNSEILQQEVNAMAHVMSRDVSEKIGVEAKIIAQYLKEAANDEASLMEMDGNVWRVKGDAFPEAEKGKIREQHVGYVVGQLADSQVLNFNFNQNLQAREVLGKILSDHLAQTSSDSPSIVSERAWSELQARLKLENVGEEKITAVKKILEQVTGWFNGDSTSYMLNQAGRIAGLNTLKFAQEVLQMSDQEIQTTFQMSLEDRKNCVLDPQKFGKKGQLIYMATSLAKMTWNVSKVNQGLSNPNKEKGIARFSPDPNKNPNQFRYIDTLEGMMRSESAQNSADQAALAAAKDTDQVFSTFIAEHKDSLSAA
jgi:hypothetical protein